MEIHVENIDDVVIIKPNINVLDAINIGEFKNKIIPIIENKTKVVFNLEHIEFIDSSGCGAFLSFLRKVNNAGGELKMYGVLKTVQITFELIRMNKVIEMFDTKEKAVTAF